MAATDVFLISSSPPRQFKNYSLISSSPPLLEELAKKQPQALRSGSQAAPIPQNATASFTSAASLFKSSLSRAITDPIYTSPIDTAVEQELDLLPQKKSVKSKITQGDSQEKLENQELVKKARKTKKSGEAEDENEPKKKARKPRAKQLVDSVEDTDNPIEKDLVKRAKKVTDNIPQTKEKPARKTKNASDNDSQTKLSKGRVTKASTKSTAKSKEASSKDKQSSQNKSSKLDDSFLADFGLDKAVKRRSNWTPPTAKPTFDASVFNDGLESTVARTDAVEKKGFADLFGTYGLAKDNLPARVPKPMEGLGIRKRKLNDLVSTHASAASTSPPKTKISIAKKAKTVTNQAISAYAEVDDDAVPPRQLLQYFPLEPTETGTNDGFKVPSKPKSRSKSPTKRGRPAKKEYILLSPQSALKEVGDQDFVFGTSSQLAREESPTLLRDLQKAMQASNENENYDPFVDIHDLQADPARQTNISQDKSLWGAAARDDTFKATEDEIWHDIDELTKAKTIIQRETEPIEVIKNEILNIPSGTSTTKGLPKEKSMDELNKVSSKTVKPSSIKMPNFESYTTAQLAKEVASYRFKPIKSRAKMIVLLEKCWEGKNRPALSILGTNKIIEPSNSQSQQKEISSPRGRGRPRKETTGTPSPKRKSTSKAQPKGDNLEELEIDSDTLSSTIKTPRRPKKVSKPAEDISDTEAEHTPSPRRRSGSRSKVASLPLKPTIDKDIEVIIPNQELVFQHITRAVKAAPRSQDSVNPSWHEKILLYDPIILEDLTAWLNTGALQNVGWDGEVEPKEVKKWCESKSICCLWKENLRGGARSHY